MKVSWTEELSVGNALIDADHRNLAALVNRMADAIRDNDRMAVTTAFELLDASMEIHIQNEERIAEAVGYAFLQDKLAQQQAVNEMKYMISKLLAMSDEWPANVQEMYSRFLTKWINEHISKINMPMKSALQAFPYEFIPGMNEGVCLVKTSMVLPIGSYIEPSPPIW